MSSDRICIMHCIKVCTIVDKIKKTCDNFRNFIEPSMAFAVLGFIFAKEAYDERIGGKILCPREGGHFPSENKRRIDYGMEFCVFL